ncbi:MAG TPA: helix-turn-helix domain-containing protein [Ktedonobacterales bacterium]|nr:helix-turn-helix domain-containing protein [Ktedonobacterales bacterium]
MSQKRAYQLKRRAERQDETRRRIAAATAALHQEIGPAATTISAIAERAGVERLTVYRHFPDEGELFRACQQVFRADHPRPDIAAWEAITEPAERLRRALRDTYAYYRETEAMTANVMRDAPGMPALAAILDDIPRYHAAAHELLFAAFARADVRLPLLRAAIGHALEFDIWRSLVRRQGLSDEQAVEVMVSFVSHVADAR